MEAVSPKANGGRQAKGRRRSQPIRQPKPPAPKSLRRRVLEIMTAVNYSLPVQLLLSQFRNHKLLLTFWLFLFLVVRQQVFKELGGPYLFLEPEYLNEFGFTSMFWLGVSFGIFSLAWQLTCYILDAHRFFFLGAIRYPFIRFSLNNSLAPTLFWLTYMIEFIAFQRRNPQLDGWDIATLLGGLLLGGLAVTAFSLIYFPLTNKDLFKNLGERIVRDLTGGRTVLIREARRTLGINIRVDWYLTSPLSVRAVPQRVKADLRSLVRILNQNHSNALVAETGILLLLLVLGLFQDRAMFRFPAGACFMLLFSFFFMLVGAISFWFRRIGLTAFLIGGLLLFLFNRSPWYAAPNQAFGLNYNKPPAVYSLDSLKSYVSDFHYQQDRDSTLRILDRWLVRQRKGQKPDYRPRMVVVCVSGGGNRSAVWTVRCLQEADRRTGGRLLAQTALITGASGGMMGAAYLREQMFRRLSQPEIDLYAAEHVERVSRDLLNPVISHLATNVLLPTPNFVDELTGRKHPRDRGYVFEQQWRENTGVFDHRRLRDYALPERHALIPMLVQTPAITNDGRKLIISSQNVSYLARPQRMGPVYENEVAAVELRKLLRRHDADHLRFTSALRMNATFPTILPFVELPTEPRIEIMDAGVWDNFGVHTAARFLVEFREWIGNNTSGVTLVQIRDTERESAILPSEQRTVLGKLGQLLGGTYLSMVESKDFINDEALDYAGQLLGGRLEVVDLEYVPRQSFEKASLSFHLTAREKEDLVQSIFNPKNERALRRLEEQLGQPSRRKP